jgi:hypothetical protein
MTDGVKIEKSGHVRVKFYNLSEDLDEMDFLPDRLGQECPVCAATGACGFDLCGRPLIHVFDWGNDD